MDIMSKEIQNYIDTSTIIDAIDPGSRFHTAVISALRQIVGSFAFSEYMEIELKGVLRKSRFNRRRDILLRNYANLKQRFNTTWIPNNRDVITLHNQSRRLERLVRRLCGGVRIRFPDIVHIGICGLKNIENIISEDWHIHGRNRHGDPFIVIVREVISQNIRNVNNPIRAYMCRLGRPIRTV